ncbi:MAG: DUF998 domain-containing protein [Candidatus Hermodarchaeota archaeon]
MTLKDRLKKFREWPISAQMMGVIIPVFTILTLISIILFGPSFNFVDHYLSTLGTQGRNPMGFLFFDVACIITGVLLFPFFYGTRHWKTDSKLFNLILYIFIGIGFIASFGIIMQAIFRGDFKPWHFYFSAVHWIANFFFLAIAPIPLLKNKKYYKSITIICVIATIFNFIYVITAGAYPWIEWITAGTSFAFGGLIGRNMVKEDFPSGL